MTSAVVVFSTDIVADVVLVDSSSGGTLRISRSSSTVRLELFDVPVEGSFVVFAPMSDKISGNWLLVDENRDEVVVFSLTEVVVIGREVVVVTDVVAITAVVVVKTVVEVVVVVVGKVSVVVVVVVVVVVKLVVVV